LKFDPSNPVFQNLVSQLKSMRPGQSRLSAPAAPTPPTAAQHAQFAELEKQFRSNPANSMVGLELASAYRQIQRTDAAVRVLDFVAANPQVDVSTLMSVAQAYAEIGDRSKLTALMQKLKGMEPGLLKQYQANTSNIPVAFQLVSVYMISQQTNEANQLLDELVSRPNADPSTLLSAAQAYLQLSAPNKLESTLQRLAKAVPDSPEAWYDLAAVQAALDKVPQAMDSLRKCFQLNTKRLTSQPGAKDLRPVAAEETRFAQLKRIPEFQQLVRTN